MNQSELTQKLEAAIRVAPKPGTQYSWGHIAWDGTPVLLYCPRCGERNTNANYAVNSECGKCGYMLKASDIYPDSPES